jgi:tRNA threonylcarbamoyladenosine biosynthesis protein TsaB
MKLFIDTATGLLQVALFDEKMIDLHTHIGKNDHSKTLMVEIEALLKRNNINAKDLTEIIVGEGPGSYTGVRIGVVVAKTLAFTLDIPLYKVSSLEVIASSRNGIVPVVIDARRGNAFCASYNVDNNFEVVVEPALRKLEDFEAMVEVEDICTIEETAIRPEILNKELVEDVHTFSPNYLREWGE